MFNPEFLLKIDHPNLPRRGDSLWAILATENGASILDFPYPLYHTRDSNLEITSMDKSLIESLEKRMSDDLIGAAMQRAMLNDDNFLPVYQARMSNQLRLIQECFELLEKAKKFIDNGSEKHGFWAMSLKERTSFCDEAKRIIDSLRIHLKEKLNQIEKTSDNSMLRIKAMRFDARMAMEEGL